MGLGLTSSFLTNLFNLLQTTHKDENANKRGVYHVCQHSYRKNIHGYITRELKGGRIIYCKECGKLVLVPEKSPAKYCKQCYDNKEKERKRLHMEKIRAN